MHPTSTSSSEPPKGGFVLPKFKPRDAEIIPECTHPWLRWGVALSLLVCAEFVARFIIHYDIVEEPVLYSMVHMDEKRVSFFEEFLPANEPGNRYLVMGSSVAHTNVSPRDITPNLEAATGHEWTGFNGGLFGIRFDDMNFFVDWYYKRWPYQHLLIVFEPWGIRRERMANLQERLSKPFFEQWLNKHSSLMAIRGQLRPRNELQSNRDRGLIALDAFDTKYGWHRTVMAFAPNQHDPGLQARLHADAMIDFSQSPPRPFEPTIELIEKLRNWAAERDIEVWWVLPPYRADLQQFMLPQFIHTGMRQLLHSIVDGHPGNHILDLSDFEDELEAEPWFDGNHMSPRGARIFSAELGKRWGQALRERAQ